MASAAPASTPRAVSPHTSATWSTPSRRRSAPPACARAKHGTSPTPPPRRSRPNARTPAAARLVRLLRPHQLRLACPLLRQHLRVLLRLARRLPLAVRLSSSAAAALAPRLSPLVRLQRARGERVDCPWPSGPPQPLAAPAQREGEGGGAWVEGVGRGAGLASRVAAAGEQWSSASPWHGALLRPSLTWVMEVRAPS